MVGAEGADGVWHDDVEGQHHARNHVVLLLGQFAEQREHAESGNGPVVGQNVGAEFFTASSFHWLKLRYNPLALSVNNKTTNVWWFLDNFTGVLLTGAPRVGRPVSASSVSGGDR